MTKKVKTLEERVETIFRYRQSYSVPEADEENKRKLLAILYSKIDENLKKKTMMYFVGHTRQYVFKRRQVFFDTNRGLEKYIQKKSNGRIRIMENTESDISKKYPVDRHHRFSITEFTSRGQHIEEVAEVAENVASGLGLNQSMILATKISALAHDYGHSVFAHTGEVALTKFLQSHETGEKKDIYFSHVTHSRIALLQEARMRGVEINEALQNAIEAHSSSDKAELPLSLYAEIVLFADKAASAVSDVRDMMKAGVLDFDKDFLVDKTREKVRKILECREGFTSVTEEEQKQLIDRTIENTKGFFRSSKKVQRDILVKGVVRETIKKNPERLEEERRKSSKTLDPLYQEFFVRPEYVSILLGVARGILDQKIKEQTYGTPEKEAESLIQEVAEYVYQHRSKFEGKEPFCNWKVDNTVYGQEREFSWERQVAYGIADFTDRQFVEFAKGLLIEPEAVKTFSKCTVIRPGQGKEVYDFGGKEQIEGLFRVNRGPHPRKPTIESKDR